MTCNSVAATAAAVEAAKVATRGIMASNLKYNAIIIGWLCVIISTVMILSSMMIINMQTNVEVLFKDLLLRQASDKEMLSITNLLAAFGTVAFAMALINFGVSLLLLIGVARNSSKLMLPWLIYHGIVFSFNLFLAIFYAIVGLFIDLSSFLMCLLVFILVLVIYCKIYHEVFTLFRFMPEKLLCTKPIYPDPEYAYACEMSYPPLYLASFPFKP